MIMWIILGSLIGVVAFFLIFTGVMDRKKTKRLKIKNREIEELKKDASDLIAIWVNFVIDYNNDLLKQFVPSIGIFKMKDLNAAAKKSLTILIKKKPYQLIKDSNDPKEQDVKKKFTELLHASSNNWTKKHAKTVEFFQVVAKAAIANEKNHAFYNQAQKIIQGVYDEFTK